MCVPFLRRGDGADGGRDLLEHLGHPRGRWVPEERTGETPADPNGTYRQKVRTFFNRYFYPFFALECSVSA